MQALYAFLRLSDDLMDDRCGVAGDNDQQSAVPPIPDHTASDHLAHTASDHGAPRSASLTLALWRQGLERAIQGQPSHPVHPALVDTIRRFGIQPGWLHAVLDGMAQDVGPVRLHTFAELYTYCWRVASAVGLACLAIWGLRRGVAWSEAEPAAIAAGIAFQLTNILRDLGEDLRRDRVYLPQEELIDFGCPVEQWAEAACRPALARLIRWQVERARNYFHMALPLIPLLPPRARTVFSLMMTLYQHLLEQVARAGPEILNQRIRLGTWQRWSFFLRAYVAPWSCPLSSNKT
jgi:phytoene synthase